MGLDDRPAFSYPEHEVINRLKLFSSTALLGAILVVVNRLSNGFGSAFVFLLFGVVFIGSYFLWIALGHLSKIDKPRFVRPKQLTIGSLLGSPLFSLGYLILLSWEQTASPTARFGDFSLFVEGATVVSVASIFLLVGLVGEILGLWRMGGRYNNISLKQGSLLFFIPFVGVIGSGLLLRGSLGISPNPSRVSPAGSGNDVATLAEP